MTARQQVGIDGPTTGASTPVYVVAGWIAITIAVMVGFGAYSGVTPKRFIPLLMLATAASVLLGPIRNVNKVLISVPALFYLAWWAASYLWTFNLWVWFRDTQVLFPLIACLVVLACTLTVEQFCKGLVIACYVAIGWTLLYTALHPGTTMSHSDGVPGWHGHFIHKNGMAPFMIFAILVISSFERSTLRRLVIIPIAIALILLSQSTTSLIVGSALVPFALFLRRLGRSPAGTRSFQLLMASTFGLAIVIASVMYLPTLVGAAGKDPTLSSRTVIWANVVDAIADRPWTGYGVGGVWVDPSAQPTRTILADLGFTVFHSHNGYLEVTLQLGLIGLALLLAFYVVYARSCLEILDRAPLLANFCLLFLALVVLTSISEVTTFGIWLSLLVTFHVLCMRVARDEVP